MTTYYLQLIRIRFSYNLASFTARLDTLAYNLAFIYSSFGSGSATILHKAGSDPNELQISLINVAHSTLAPAKLCG